MRWLLVMMRCEKPCGNAFKTLKIVGEPGGVVTLAAALSGKIDCKGKNVVLIISGGNVDTKLFAQIIGE